MKLKSGLLFFLALITSACATLAEKPRITINELMIQTVTPATNILWGVEEPNSDAEWLALANAAKKVRLAAIETGQGGDLSDGKNPSAEPEWQKLVDQMATSATLAQEAITKKDLDALIDAGNELYTSCEMCHQLYHPSVKADS